MRKAMAFGFRRKLLEVLDLACFKACFRCECSFCWLNSEIILQLRIHSFQPSIFNPIVGILRSKTMTDNPSFAESIKHSINKSGFPKNAVRLPFKPVFEASKRYKVSLKEVLNELKQEQIFGQIIGDHIEFRSDQHPAHTDPQPSDQPATHFPDAANFDSPEDLEKAAKDFMAQMNPDQMEEMRKKVDSMSEEEKKNMIDMISKNFKTGS